MSPRMVGWGHGMYPGDIGQEAMACPLGCWDRLCCGASPGTPGIAVPRVWGRPWDVHGDIRVLGLCRVVCPGQGTPRNSGLGKQRQFLGVVAVMAILVLARLSLAMAALGCSNTQICKSFLTSTAQHGVLGLCFGNEYPAHTLQKVCAHGHTAKISLYGGLGIQSSQDRVSQRPHVPWGAAGCRC